jgi:hypothetical protein
MLRHELIPIDVHKLYQFVGLRRGLGWVRNFWILVGWLGRVEEVMGWVGLQHLDPWPCLLKPSYGRSHKSARNVMHATCRDI